MRSSAERDGALELTRPVGLLYAVDDPVPAGMLVLSALQHVGVIATTLFYPLILAREVGLDPGATLNYMSLCMLTLAVGTALLCLRSSFVGSGYLCPAGYTQIFLGPSLYALQNGRACRHVRDDRHRRCPAGGPCARAATAAPPAAV